MFQQAVLRNLTDKNAQLTKQLDNVVREGGLRVIVLNESSYMRRFRSQ